MAVNFLPILVRDHLLIRIKLPTLNIFHDFDRCDQRYWDQVLGKQHPVSIPDEEVVDHGVVLCPVDVEAQLPVEIVLVLAHPEDMVQGAQGAEYSLCEEDNDDDLVHVEFEAAFL